MSVVRNHVLVDANIARSATDPARHPTSTACYELARTLLSRSSDSGIAMTPALKEEWRRHASPTMVSWLASMENRRRVRKEEDRRVRDLREAVSSVDDVGVRTALEKDIHISEAAILHGLPVASRDDRQRQFLSRISSHYPLAGRVQWFNPVVDADWEEWVRCGCVDRHSYRCCED